jgi:ABC-type lipoprotein export system ATPase subunit
MTAMTPVGPDAALLDLDGIGATYPGVGGGPAVSVLSDLSLEVRPGVAIVLAGRSGSGKTTALEIAAGLLLPTAGTVRWRGRDPAAMNVRRRTAARRELMGIVFQDGGLIPTLTAVENVLVAAASSAKARAGRHRAAQLLDRVGVGHRSRNFPAQLSGGEQQRVAVARALFNEAPLLVLDEPTASLDRTGAEALIAMLLTLRDDGRALLVATHDPALIEVADEVHRTDHAEPVGDLLHTERRQLPDRARR